MWIAQSGSLDYSRLGLHVHEWNPAAYRQRHWNQQYGCQLVGERGRGFRNRPLYGFGYCRHVHGDGDQCGGSDQISISDGHGHCPDRGSVDLSRFGFGAHGWNPAA
jgi:hypothetical protein